MHVIDDDSEFAVVIKIALFDFARCVTCLEFPACALDQLAHMLDCRNDNGVPPLN